MLIVFTTHKFLPQDSDVYVILSRNVESHFFSEKNNPMEMVIKNFYNEKKKNVKSFCSYCSNVTSYDYKVQMLRRIELLSVGIYH